MDARFSFLLLRRYGAPMGLVFLLLAVATTGSLIGRDGADAEPDMSGVVEKRLLSNLQTVGDGSAVVSIDESAGLVCVQARLGQAGGGACNSLDDPNPWIHVTGGDAGGPAVVTVVDGQRRLETALLPVNGQTLTAQSQDGGFSISLQVPIPPAEVVILGTGGLNLGIHYPHASITSGQLSSESAPQDAGPDH